MTATMPRVELEVQEWQPEQVEARRIFYHDREVTLECWAPTGSPGTVQHGFTVIGQEAGGAEGEPYRFTPLVPGYRMVVNWDGYEEYARQAEESGLTARRRKANQAAHEAYLLLCGLKARRRAA